MIASVLAEHRNAAAQVCEFAGPPTAASSAAVQTLSGRHITIGEDRIVEMSAEDRQLLDPRKAESH